MLKERLINALITIPLNITHPFKELTSNFLCSEKERLAYSFSYSKCKGGQLIEVTLKTLERQDLNISLYSVRFNKSQEVINADLYLMCKLYFIHNTLNSTCKSLITTILNELFIHLLVECPEEAEVMRIEIEHNHEVCINEVLVSNHAFY